MKPTMEKIKKLNYTVSFLLTHEMLDENISSKISDLQGRVKMKGFRKGKVPLDIVREQYEGSVRGEVIQKEAEKILADYYKTKDIRPASAPKVDLKDDKKGFVLTAGFDILPEIKEVKFDKIVLEKEVSEVSDKELDDSLNNIAESRREMIQIKEKRPLKKGDVAVIDFEGFLEGKPFEGGKADSHYLELGSNQFIPGFEEALVGKEIGGEYDIPLTFPKEYGAKHLSGKKVVFKVKVHEIREKKLPKMDDAFAKSLKLKDLEDLKKTVREQLSKQKDQVATQKLKDDLLDALTDKVKMDLPQSLVDQEIEVLKKTSEKDAKEKDLVKQAEQRVTLGLVLGDFGKKFDVKVSRDEVKGALMQYAMGRHPNPQELLKEFDKNPNNYSQFYAMIFEDKVLDAILKKVTIKEVKPKKK
ncbi:MAG: trigger factor [Alphaproteobacteria bacterium]|nr:trigger factor [Alphaproteobacteria bacterium]